MIIIFEGLDNSGKTTLIENLSNALSSNYNVKVSKEFETDTGIVLKNGLKENKYSPQNKALLFAADRQERLDELQRTNAYDIVFFDRYIYSAIVYRQSEGLEEEWIRTLNKFNPKEDLGFYIDITADESIKRNNSKKFNVHYPKEQLEEVRKNYLRIIESENLIRIDGMKESEKITNEVLNIILNNFKETNQL